MTKSLLAVIVLFMIFSTFAPSDATSVNVVHDDVGDAFVTSTTGDEVLSGIPMYGKEYMYFFLSNLPDATHDWFLNPNITLVSPYSPSSFWGIYPSPNSTSLRNTDYVYTWLTSDLSEEGMGASPCWSAFLQENQTSVKSLNFASKRQVPPEIIETASIVVNLTVLVVPTEPVERLCIEVHLGDTTKVDAEVIQSRVVPQPSPYTGLNFTSTSRVYWELLNPTVSKEYRFIVPISVVNKVYPHSVIYKPRVHIYTHFNFEYWKVVDGNSVSFRHPKYGNVTFSADGEYRWLTVWKLSKIRSLDYLKIETQTDAPHGPKAEFAVFPETANVGETAKFDASASLPGWNGTHEMLITEYCWDFDDGNQTTTSTPIVYHSFSSSGIYYVTLTVYAPGAIPETDSTTKKVTITAIPVGGYSIPIKGYIAEKPLTLYLALIGILTVSFTIVKRRKKQQS